MSEATVNTADTDANGQASTASATSHGEALKSASIVGGSTAIVMMIKIVRTKALVLLLGPVGVGLEAIYDNILNLARTLASLGTSTSAVRQLAAATESGDEERVAVTVITLRRITWFLGTASSVLLFLFRGPIAHWSFPRDRTPSEIADHANGIGVLSIALLFTAINGGQGALLQGKRRIGDLARMGIMGMLLGTVVSIPVVYIWGLKGVSCYMVVGAANMVLMSWYYARRVYVKKVAVSARQVMVEASAMLKLGLALMSSTLLFQGAVYITGILVTGQTGVAGMGQYSAGNKISLVYISFIIQAMATDFYPRLTMVVADPVRCNQVVNEQVEVSLLLALPGILATIAFGPWAIWAMYSRDFNPAITVLSWQAAGSLLRVLCSPLGMILVAREKGRLYLWTELVATIVYLGLSWLGLKYLKLPGIGVAFLATYLFYWAMIYVVVRKQTGFRWSPVNLRLKLLGAVVIAMALAAHFLLPVIWGTLAGALLAAGVGVYCLRILAVLVGVKKIERRLHGFGIRVPVAKWLGVADTTK
jgi:antigen flippase